MEVCTYYHCVIYNDDIFNLILLFRPEHDASQKLHRKNLKHQAQRRRFQRMRNARKRIRELEKASKRARQSGRRDRVKYMNEDI